MEKKKGMSSSLKERCVSMKNGYCSQMNTSSGTSNSQILLYNSSGECSWPPRCYPCTYCKREFRSAQALGGHMNVHRRDRARLRLQDHINTTTSSFQFHPQSPPPPNAVLTLNPNPTPPQPPHHHFAAPPPNSSLNSFNLKSNYPPPPAIVTQDEDVRSTTSVIYTRSALMMTTDLHLGLDSSSSTLPHHNYVDLELRLGR